MACSLGSDPIYQLEENLQCTVCLERLNDPRTLPCCHSFCKVCLEGVVKTCRDEAPRDRPIREIPCPNCRTMFVLDPDKQVADMPRNHFICNMVQTMAVLDRGIGVPCSHSCSQSYSVARCVTCEKFLCRECLTDHNKYRGNSGHSVLTMEELSKPENRKKIQDQMYCNEHSRMILKVYCETCDQLICKDCMDFKHVKQSHSCVLVKDETLKYKGLLALNNKDMKTVLTEGNAFLQQLTHETERLDHEFENIKSQIVQKKELLTKEVNQVLDQKADMLLKKVDEIHKRKRADLVRQTEETNQYVENIKRSVQLSKELVDQGTDEEIISSQKMMLGNAKNLLTKRETYFKAPVPVTKLNYTSAAGEQGINIKIVAELVNSLGDVNDGDNEKGEDVVKNFNLEKTMEVVKKLKNRENSKERESTTVEVSGIPDGFTENILYIHFQKKKNGGGEVKKLEMLGDGKARVTFEDPQVAERVVNTQQKINGNTLEVKSLGTENMKLRNKESSEEKESTTIEVSGLPDGTTEISVYIHFQKKKNGGGEVKKVEMLEDGKARVTFKDPRVAKTVLEIPQVFKGKKLVVKLQEPETTPDNEVPERKNFDETRTILVSDLPEGVSESDVYIHFQKKRNGGGEVENVIISQERNKALVVFEDRKVARNAVETCQQIKGKILTVTSLHEESSPEMKKEPELKMRTVKVQQEDTTTPKVVCTPEFEKPPEPEIKDDKRRQIDETSLAARASLVTIDPVFYMVTATANPMLMSTRDEYFWSNVFNEIQRSCRIQCQVSAYGITLSGSLSQVTRAGQILQHKWTNYNRGGTKAYQNFNEHDPHYTQSGTTPYQPGTTHNQRGTTSKQPGTIPPYQPGTTHNQRGTTSKQPGSIPPYQPGTTACQPGTPFANQPGTLPPYQPGTLPPY